MSKTRNISLLILATLVATPQFGKAQFDFGGAPELTDQVVNDFIRSCESLVLAKFNPDQRSRMKGILQKLWNDGQTPQAVIGTIDGSRQLAQLPERTQRLALMANILGFLTRAEDLVQQGDDYSALMLEVYRSHHKPLHPQAPLFTKPIADVYIDAFLFLGMVQSGKPEPKIGEASREKLRLELARDYAKADRKARDQFQLNVGQVIGHMIHWPTMDALQKLLVRADLGAKLTPEEQSYVVQARQMMSNHAHQMMSSQLNFMKQNSEIIMGSAPLWNPTTNRWEQKGGIVTEFGVTSVK